MALSRRHCLGDIASATGRSEPATTTADTIPIVSSESLESSADENAPSTAATAAATTAPPAMAKSSDDDDTQPARSVVPATTTPPGETLDVVATRNEQQEQQPEESSVIAVEVAATTTKAVATTTTTAAAAAASNHDKAVAKVGNEPAGKGEALLSNADTAPVVDDTVPAPVTIFARRAGRKNIDATSSYRHNDSGATPKEKATAETTPPPPPKLKPWKR
jgi:hypothetical protein